MTAKHWAATGKSSGQVPRLAAYRRTEVGRVRAHNEDSSSSDPEAGVFIVADGMGGHAAGEIASRLTVEEVQACFGEERDLLRGLGRKSGALGQPAMTALLERVGKRANQVVRKRASEDPAYHGMGTTLEMLVIAADGAWLGHVGDSRTYLVRDGRVTQMTTDHTLAQQLSGEHNEALGDAIEKWGNVLVQAIGARDVVEVEVRHIELREDDCLLMCSDGLYEYFPRNEEIAEILAMEGNEAGLQRMVELALDRGGKDNITGLLVVIEEVPPPVVAPLRDADEQGYGIDEAIALMRRLPEDEMELVVSVVKKTLESTQICVPAIIEDAEVRQQELRGRVAQLRRHVKLLEEEVTDRQEEIELLYADRDETAMVKERLEMAMKPAKSAG